MYVTFRSEDKASGAVVRPLTSCLNGELRTLRLLSSLCYDFVNGFKIIDPVNGQQGYESAENIMKQLGLQPANGCAPAGLDLFEEVLEKVISMERRANSSNYRFCISSDHSSK